MAENTPRRLTPLPIVQVDPLDRAAPIDKYGSFRYVSLLGLVALAGLIGWFAWSVWSMREVWRQTYVLHNAKEPEAARVAAARWLARDRRVEPRQLYDISLERSLPAEARAIAALALTPAAVSDDPRGRALAVARSEGWPDWLRLLHLRTLARAAAEGQAMNRAALAELAAHDDPIIRLWAAYAQSESVPDDPRPLGQIAAAAEGPLSELARCFQRALSADGTARNDALREADAWTLRNHAELARFDLLGGDGDEAGAARVIRPSKSRSAKPGGSRPGRRGGPISHRNRHPSLRRVGD